MTPAFPRLSATNHRPTSPVSGRYNCIAWAADEDFRWWQPGRPYYWPLPDDPAPYTTDGLIRAYAAVGFVQCDDEKSEAGFVKVALYAGDNGRWTHAARLLTSGGWTSKLGRGEDIEHETPDVVGGGMYGEVFAYMKRPLPSPG